MAINEFAEALTVIPKTLALNAALDAIDLLAKLKVVHVKSQSDTENEQNTKLKFCGLDLNEGKIRNNKNEGVFEPAISKVKQIRFATEAAITILRIDDMITLNPKPQQDPRGGRGGCGY